MKAFLVNDASGNYSELRKTINGAIMSVLCSLDLEQSCLEGDGEGFVAVNIPTGLNGCALERFIQREKCILRRWQYTNGELSETLHPLTVERVNVADYPHLEVID